MEPYRDHVVVKTEVQSNGEILLFYVDENGGNEEGVLTTVQNIESEAIELQQIANTSSNTIENPGVDEDGWTDDQINRLLIFYIDNKNPFLSGATKRDHLWTVACKTMLIGKNPAACEAKLKSLRDKYFEACWFQKNGIDKAIEYQDLCNQAFHDKSYQVEIFEPAVQEENPVHISIEHLNNENASANVNQVANPKVVVDEKVKLLLSLYQKYRKILQKDYSTRKDFWDVIAREIGEDDGVYWQKRFNNYKQHYLRMVEKRKNGGIVKWPYMEMFDKLNEDQTEMPKKHTLMQGSHDSVMQSVKNNPNYWNDTELTVLAKYCFDCFDEFQDDTVPKNFLWSEIGRLLDRPSEMCKLKYDQLKIEHYDKYMGGDYEIRKRKPLQIILDNIIFKEVEIELKSDKALPTEIWKEENIDELVRFMYQNVEMFKDQICHYVCWGAVSKRLRKELRSCKKHWDDLVQEYKNMLENKKEYPSMQIEWRYIELFDRIFDYGMDTKLLNGYENTENQKGVSVRKASNVKKVNTDKDTTQDGSDDDIDIYDDDDAKGSKHAGDSKAFKILEYYQKNKDKFTSPHRNKHSLWEVLAKQIGISATQCAHRLRNLKQVYTGYVQREINKPEMPIFWPYYVLCKKVFGYRAIKAKLKNAKKESDSTEEWAAKEIKMLLNYLAQNFNMIDSNVDDSSYWSNLANEIGKSQQACKEKFLELRKSYRKLRTKMNNNPNLKISWKYFNMMDNIYGDNVINNTNAEQENMEVEQLEEWMEEDRSQQDDDDYQCIIILPEDQDISSIQTSQIEPDNIIETETSINIESKPTMKWNKQLKKRLLVSYIKYVKKHKDKKINAKEMWTEIGKQLDKKPIMCKKMLAKLKANYMKSKDSTQKRPYQALLERIMKLKPKYERTEKNIANEEKKVYKDVEMSHENVLKTLQYYLQHIDEFTSPKFDKKCMWQELADFVMEPVSKVYNKIHYLKQVFNAENTTGVAEFDGIVKEIVARDAMKVVDDGNVTTEIVEDTPWSDEEMKNLLEWYLSNLEKFKNPKFVRKYLWMEVSQLLNKSPLGCSKIMTEIRMQYKSMVKERPEDLDAWQFSDLCQKIYGTGKKAVT